MALRIAAAKTRFGQLRIELPSLRSVPISRLGTHVSPKLCFRATNCFGLRHIPPTLVLTILLCAAAATAANINGAGASLNLPTTDLSSVAAQSNGAGGRLVAAGTPSVGIVSTNAAGAKLIVEPLNAVAGGTTPEAEFVATPESGKPPLMVEFTDASKSGIYPITSWSWDFGDNTPVGTEQNPTHVYDHPGAYTVTLTVTTPGGSVTKTRTGYIIAASGVPASSRAGLGLLAAALATVAFTRLLGPGKKREKPQRDCAS